VPYNTTAGFAVFHIERKIINDLYGGIGYKYTTFDTSNDSINFTSTNQLHGLSFSVSMDKRSNVYYPRKGIFANINFDVFPEWIGNENQSSSLDVDYNQYFSVRSDRDILAARFYAGIGFGDINFNQQKYIGNDDLRGYMDGKYRGESVMALQAEYRWNFYKNFGAVGFAGIATVFGAINEEQNGMILPSVGAGVRYKLMGDMVSVGMDFAVGKDDYGFYFRISEAF
jgi:outer membrane protein assembly factor BamA